MSQLDEAGLQARRKRFEQLMDGFRAEANAVLKNAGGMTAFEQKGYVADLATILKALDGAA
jgi:hypothetical protein